MKLSSQTGSLVRTNAKYWEGVEADDIPPGWMDDMVRRLLDVLNREMIRLETAQASISDKPGPDGKPPPYDVVEAERRGKLAKQMQTSLEKLREMAEDGAKKRKRNVGRTDEQALAELECRFDQLVTARENKGDASEPDAG